MKLPRPSCAIFCTALSALQTIDTILAMLILILLIFSIGYVAIALEHKIGINKAAIALLIGTVCWAVYITHLPALLPAEAIPEWFEIAAGEEAGDDIPLHYAVDSQHLHQTGEIASILFFLMGAMTIVELIDAHEGFSLVTDRIQFRSKRKLLWCIGLLTFFLSAVLDNLTSTIVMVSLLKKLVRNRDDRLLFIGLVVIAANAGGAWTVIGDVTTTMLWIKHKIGPVAVMHELFLGSVVCLIVPMLGFSWKLSGELEREPDDAGLIEPASDIRPWHQWLFLVLGLASLLFVPVFKTLTHLPPYMGMMLSLSVLWVISELVGRSFDERTKSQTGVLSVLKRVDMSSVLFFLGILLAVGALSATGFLRTAAGVLDSLLPNEDVVAIVIGLLSSVVDNVPLVAAGIDMFDQPLNDEFWMLLAYCAGTGGSCLIIGSAAGVAAMGLEKIDFLWYARYVAPWAVLGYLCGAVVVIFS